MIGRRRKQPQLLIFALLILASVTAAAGGPGDRSTPEADVPIVPGQRIGAITVGMTPDQMTAILGRPERVDRYPERNVLSYDWKSQGYLVSFFLDSRKTRIVAAYGTMQRFRTDRGIRLMMHLDRAVRAYGSGFRRADCPQDKITLVRYDDLGVQFAAVHEPGRPIHGLLFSIGVFRPRLLQAERIRCTTP